QTSRGCCIATLSISLALNRWSNLTSRINAALLCVFVSLWLTGCGGTPAHAPTNGAALEKTHLTIALSVPGATYLPLYVAVDEGTFAKEGIQADIVEFRGGSDVIRATVSGSVDVGVVALAEITAGIDAGQPLKAFYAGFNIP